MWGGVGALCLSLWEGDSVGISCYPDGSRDPNEDKHKAPSSTPPRPLSLQDTGPQASHFCIRLAKFIRMLGRKHPLHYSIRVPNIIRGRSQRSGWLRGNVRDAHLNRAVRVYLHL